MSVPFGEIAFKTRTGIRNNINSGSTIIDLTSNVYRKLKMAADQFQFFFITTISRRLIFTLHFLELIADMVRIYKFELFN